LEKLVLASCLTIEQTMFSIKHLLIRGLLFIACIFLGATSSISAELLSNRSFETPVAPNNGNNFYTTIPNWTVVSSPVVATPFNIVVPHAGYANNPQATPTGGGRQYLDINGAGGTLSQTVTLSSNGFVSFGVWFSVRDGSRNLAGGIVRLRNSANAIVSSASVTFFTTDPISTWKRASVTNLAVPVGTYRLEIVMDNFHNIDLASLDFVPATYSLQLDKSADKTGPLVVGNLITYTYLVKNNGTWAVTNINVADVHGGVGSLPVPGSEALLTDVAPLGDSTDPAIALPSSADGSWNTLGPGDTVRFTATYTVTQTDVDLLQ
jgi:hypothetical protein